MTAGMYYQMHPTRRDVNTITIERMGPLAITCTFCTSVTVRYDLLFLECLSILICQNEHPAWPSQCYFPTAGIYTCTSDVSHSHDGDAGGGGGGGGGGGSRKMT